MPRPRLLVRSLAPVRSSMSVFRAGNTWWFITLYFALYIPNLGSRVRVSCRVRAGVLSNLSEIHLT